MIRPYTLSDKASLFNTCIATDFTVAHQLGKFQWPQLIPQVWAEPYLEHDPGLAFVLDDDGAVGGYVIATADTRAFNEWAIRKWWPQLQEQYAGVTASPGYADGWLLQRIATPPTTPEFAAEFPAHLHINLLPQWQSGGWGRRLLERLEVALRDQNVRGLHLGVSRTNESAEGFYRHIGFTDIVVDEHTAWLGKVL